MFEWSEKKQRWIDEDGFITGPTPSPPVFCVAVKKTGDKVMVRDTKDPDKTTLTFNHGEWKVFLKGVRNGEFDV